MDQITCGDRPPEIAVIHFLPANRMRAAGFVKPSFWHDPFSVHHTIMQNKRSKPSVIPQRGAKSTSGKSNSTGRFRPPRRVFFHSQRRPKSLREVRCQRLVCDAFQKRSAQERFARTVIPDRTLAPRAPP